MFTLLVQTERGPTARDAYSVARGCLPGPVAGEEPAVDDGSIPWPLGRGSRRK
ncbi:Hypothetical protein A7982_04924 [Minicystis rosea]|nr:Hypothetical protein A7982_04924 [Minicystis rosea]